MAAFFLWGRTCWESGKVGPCSPWHWTLHGVVRGREGIAMTGLGAVILLNESFTISLSER